MGLETKNLTIRLEDKTILRDVNIVFSTGKRTAIIGPNGAGKSTLLRALASLNTHYAGQVLLEGTDVKTLGRKRLAQRLAILPQGMAAPPDITVGALVDYGRFPYRSWMHAADAKADREAVEWALERTHLLEFRHRQVMSLSGGERQRAWIAMALAQQPEILLLDEPTTYLDIGHQLEVMNIIEELNRDYQMTIIMVLHDINHALQYADEIVVVKNKGIFAQGKPVEVLTPEMLAAVFGVQAELLRSSDGRLVLAPMGITAP